MSNRNYPNRWVAKFLMEAAIPKGAHITAASVVAFTNKGTIVTILQTRGLSIPGGHVDPGESPVDAALREASEEAMISRLSTLTLASVIEWVGGYLVSYVADLLEMKAFVATNTQGEVLERLEMLPEDFLKDARVDKISHEIVRRANLIYKAWKEGNEHPVFEEFAIEMGK